MNLICPHCQKMASVPDTSAGQMMNCPFCNQSFAVPVLPSMGSPTAPPPVSNAPPVPPPTSPPADENSVFKLAVEPPKPTLAPRREERPREPAVPPPPRETIPQPARPPVSAPSDGRVATLRLGAHGVAWIAPVALVLALLFMFFSWTGSYPGGYGIYTQTGMQTAYGGHSFDPVGDKVYQKEPDLAKTVHTNWSMTIYLLLVLASLVLAVWPLAETLAKFRLPPAIENLRPWRSSLLFIALLLALLFLLLRLWSGFGLEEALIAPIDEEWAEQRAAAQTTDEKESAEIKRGQQLGALAMRRNAWLCGEVIFILAAFVGANLEVWLLRRGDRSPPRIEFHW
jgi:hypothetical protein